VPSPLPPGTIPDPPPSTGTILLDASGDAAFPGVIDDWYNLLNEGHRVVGTGVSDSHAADEEAGYFRTMIYVGDDDPASLTESRITAALRAGRVVATNGPLVDVFVDDAVRGAMGSTITHESGPISLHVHVTAAPWIALHHLNVVRNGTIATTIDVDPARDLSTQPLDQTLTIDLATNAAGAPIDSWFVVEAIGDRSFFPVVAPLELPPLLLTDAISSLAGPLGLGSNASGALQPARVFRVSAYAITNPVWVTTGDHDFQPSGAVPRDVQISAAQDPHFFATASGLVTADPVESPGIAAARTVHLRPFDPRPNNPFDVRNVLFRLVH
jgi:hypothetical protein